MSGGGVFLHDAGKRFNSPTVNLATNGEGFIKFLSNPESFYNGEFEERKSNKVSFPVGRLNGITVSFVHYKTLEEGKEKWKLRSKRILKNHIYIIATGHNGLETPELMDRFDKLPYKHKVMFTFGKWDYEWAKQVKYSHGKDIPFTGIVTLTGKRFYETASFNLSKWISRCEEEYSSQKK